MIPKAGYYTPLLHVNSIEESTRFYALLGFETIDQMGERGRLGWARMHCEGGALMFLRAEEPHFPKKKFEVLFAMYTPDLPAFGEAAGERRSGTRDYLSRIYAQRFALAG